MMSMKSDAMQSASGSTLGKPLDKNKVAGLMRRATSRRRLKPDQPPKDDDGKKEKKDKDKSGKVRLSPNLLISFIHMFCFYSILEQGG